MWNSESDTLVLEVFLEIFLRVSMRERESEGGKAAKTSPSIVVARSLSRGEKFQEEPLSPGYEPVTWKLWVALSLGVIQFVCVSSESGVEISLISFSVD